MPVPEQNKPRLSDVTDAKASSAQGRAPGTNRIVELLTSLRRREWVFGLFLFVATILVYQQAWHGKPIWDDNAHLTPPGLRSFQGLVYIWTKPGTTQQYYPLTFSLFWLESNLWGYATLAYHFVNILLHAFSAFLLWKILRRLEVRGAYLAPAIFALHPVCVESVAWISEVKNCLSGVFYLSAALVYLKFDQSRNRKPYFFALGLFLLGLMSKTDIATLPAALLVVFWWQRAKIFWKRDVLPLIPFFVMGIGAGLFTAWMEWKFVGARGPEYDFTFVERLLIAGRAIWFYLDKLMWPVDLIFNYPHWHVSQTVWWQYLFPATALLVSVVLWVLSRRKRGPLAAWLFFVGTLFPALGFFNVYPFRFSFVADHFQYLASIGPIVVAAAGINKLLHYLKNKQPLLRPLFCGTLLLLVLGALTWRQCGMYSDSETLWRITIARNPDSLLAHNHLGFLLLQQGHTEQAIEQFHQALQINPNSWVALDNLGFAFAKKGQLDKAIAYFLRSLTSEPGNPGTEHDLCSALLLEEQNKQVIAHYEAAIKLEPTNVVFLNNFAWLLATSPQAGFRNGPEAVQLAERACRLTDYKAPAVIETLAAAYAEAGRFDDAVAASEKAYNLALSHGQESLVVKLQQLLQLFKAHRPYHRQAGQDKTPPGKQKSQEVVD